jgi:hypothetical protein
MYEFDAETKLIMEVGVLTFHLLIEEYEMEERFEDCARLVRIIEKYNDMVFFRTGRTLGVFPTKYNDEWIRDRFNELDISIDAWIDKRYPQFKTQLEKALFSNA